MGGRAANLSPCLVHALLERAPSAQHTFPNQMAQERPQLWHLGKDSPGQP